METAPFDEAADEAPRLDVLAGRIVPAGSSANNAIVARDLARYEREHRDGLTSLCDLHSYPALDRLARLDCGAI